jgi:hypothetical protein
VITISKKGGAAPSRRSFKPVTFRRYAGQYSSGAALPSASAVVGRERRSGGSRYPGAGWLAFGSLVLNNHSGKSHLLGQGRLQPAGGCPRLQPGDAKSGLDLKRAGFSRLWWAPKPAEAGCR